MLKVSDFQSRCSVLKKINTFVHTKVAPPLSLIPLFILSVSFCIQDDVTSQCFSWDVWPNKPSPILLGLCLFLLSSFSNFQKYSAIFSPVRSNINVCGIEQKAIYTTRQIRHGPGWSVSLEHYVLHKNKVNKRTERIKKISGNFKNLQFGFQTTSGNLVVWFQSNISLSHLYHFQLID